MPTARMSGQSKWKGRLPTRIYDYNYKLSENYYQPQTDYISESSLRREKETPPEAQTYAERFAERPFYGSTRGLPYDAAESATYEPLVNPHGKSASRASSLLKDRARAKSLEPESTFDDKWNEMKKEMKKSRRIDFDDDFKRKPKEDVTLEDYSAKMMPIRTKAAPSIEKELEKIDERLASRPKRVTHDEYRVYDSDLNPGRRTVTREEKSYSIPGSDTTVTRSSYKTTSTFDSSKPSWTEERLTSRPKVSREEYRVYDSNFNPGRRTVTREEQSYSLPGSNTKVIRSSYKTSSSHESSKPPSGYKFESTSTTETEPKKNRLAKAYNAREARHAREEDILTTRAHRLVDKLSDRGFDKFGDRAFENLSVSRLMRSTSLDPF